MIIITIIIIIAAAVSEPEASEQGSSLIGRKTQFSSKRKELYLCANGEIKMRGVLRSLG